MRKTVVILFVSIFLVIGVWVSYDYISRDGEFTKWSHTTLDIENFKKNVPYYIGYSFKWEGIGNPTIESIDFIKRDGIIVTKDDVDLRIHPFIATSTNIGSLEEEYVIEEGLLDGLNEVNGFQVDENFNLVVRVELVDASNFDNDISTIRITYKKYGITQTQNIPFDGGFVTDLE